MRHPGSEGKDTPLERRLEADEHHNIGERGRRAGLTRDQEIMSEPELSVCHN